MRTIVFNDTSIDDHHGCQLVMRQIEKLAMQSGMDVIVSCPLGHDWEADDWLKMKVRKADICIVNGEGTMHDDAPNAMRLGRLAKYCSEQGVPCFLINSVWQNNHALNEYACFFSLIYVRDPLSQAELAKLGLSASVVPDLTLSLEVTGSSKPRRGIIINGSVLPQVLIEAWGEACNARDEDLRYMSIRTLPPQPLKKSLEHFTATFSAKRRKMIRHIISSFFRRYPPSASGKTLSRLRWRYATLSTDAFLKRIQESEGIITGRFHMVTLCLITKTPFYSLRSNTFKIEGLLGELGLGHRICLSYQEALSRRQAIEFSEVEHVSILRYIEGARIKASDMFQEIYKVALVSKEARL